MENKKIKNATKVVQDGIIFDSKLEFFCNNKLHEAGVPFELKKKFVSVEKFEYLGEKLREIAHYPDFFLYNHNIILDTKGFKNDIYPIKAKILKKHFHDEGNKYIIITVKNQKEILKFIEDLLNPNWYITLFNPKRSKQFDKPKKKKVVLSPNL